VEALAAAGRLTTDSLVKAMESGRIRGGPGLVPIRYSTFSHIGYTGVRLTRRTHGAAVYFGPSYAIGPDGDVRAFNDVPDVPPADGIPR
jgi:hypothetical protein